VSILHTCQLSALGYHAKAAPPTVTLPCLKVKDTVQVDYNVSRHLSYELYKNDWNLLEMDEVIKMIHKSAIRSQESDHKKTLLMVVSDHGMQENGNHRGSSYEETNSLALFIGPRSSHVSATDDTINQRSPATEGTGTEFLAVAKKRRHGKNVTAIDNYKIAHYCEKKKRMVSEEDAAVLNNLRSEEAAGSGTPVEICFKLLKRVSGHLIGRSTLKKEILAVENLMTIVKLEKNKSTALEEKFKEVTVEQDE
nr:GPI ethanolamine phosphate transferase 2 isoform X2 [Tanacetum cinerariifolium]